MRIDKVLLVSAKAALGGFDDPLYKSGQFQGSDMRCMHALQTSLNCEALIRRSVLASGVQF